MIPLICLLIIFLSTITAVWGPDVKTSITGRKQLRLESKAEADRVARMFVEYPEMTGSRSTFVNGESMALYKRLEKIWYDTDDETVKDAAKLIAEKHLFPAVRLATKSARDIQLHLSLIEPNVKHLEEGMSHQLIMQLEMMTNYLTQVANGVRALPSSLNIDRPALEGSPVREKDAPVNKFFKSR